MKINENENRVAQNLWEAAKILKWKFIVTQAYIGKQEKSQKQTNKQNSNLASKGTGKRKQKNNNNKNKS